MLKVKSWHFPINCVLHQRSSPSWGSWKPHASRVYCQLGGGCWAELRPRWYLPPLPAEELGLSESQSPGAEGPSTVNSPQLPAKPGEPTGERPPWWHRCRGGLRGLLPPPPLPPPRQKNPKNIAGGCRWAEPCRCAAGDDMAIYLVGLAVPGSAAWGVRKRCFHGAGKPATNQGPSPPPPSWQTPCLPSGPRVRVPPVPQHCHPLSPPRCKAEHWDGRSSPAPRGTGRHLGLGTPTQFRGGPARHLPSHPLAAAPSVASEVPGRCLSSKIRVSCPPCKRCCVQYRCGPAAAMLWGSSGPNLWQRQPRAGPVCIPGGCGGLSFCGSAHGSRKAPLQRFRPSPEAEEKWYSSPTGWLGHPAVPGVIAHPWVLCPAGWQGSL